MARATLFSISFAIGIEERKKKLANPGRLVGSLPDVLRGSGYHSTKLRGRHCFSAGPIASPSAE